uniref:ribosomal protein S14 n=1 Tax=Meteora sporadica TaxID=2913902 RepID=UPI00300343CA|nr:ribosomal protein S14 [Meteora sporadica]WVH37086.1 ribosomal protein S14 [Meteora sporadica]
MNKTFNYKSYIKYRLNKSLYLYHSKLFGKRKYKVLKNTKYKCFLSGRQRGNYRLIHASRFYLHRLGASGLLPGVTKK